ncbi:hypothetical protein NE237_029308 [Protea cynaroides]|uniref:Uncharacterized protein n=1 Tax=Protea cynaroides TaxID=273540 RepID=A0A9Q0GQX7_9MAGN|nr:hypothetical protein NE237_029308 [Protea cynaroides]
MKHLDRSAFVGKSNLSDSALSRNFRVLKPSSYCDGNLCSVVDGDNDSEKFTSESTTEEVVGFTIGAEERESSAVEENDDYETDISRGFSWCEEAKPEVSIGVNGDFRGFDAFDCLSLDEETLKRFQPPEFFRKVTGPRFSVSVYFII